MYEKMLEEKRVKISHDFENDVALLKCPELSPEDDSKIWSSRIRICRNVANIGHTLTPN